jgi:carboxypeptidase family protein
MAPLAVSAQSNASDGALDGYVHDENSAVIPGAKIVARNLQTNIELTANADGQGYFRFPLLRVGSYEIVASAGGFGEFKQTGVSIEVGRQVRLSITLKVGAASETVTISADASVIETGQTAVAEVVGEKQIRSLPITSRNIYNFHLLGPGVKGLPSSGFGTTQFLFGGTNRSTWSVDGLDNTARRNNRQIRLVINTPEAVEQTQVVSNSYSAEFGRAAGGQINVITRSGANQFHGSALGIYRPNELAARPGLSRTRPEATWRDLAFTLGGPIIKDKLFFFGQYEYNPLTSPIPVTITTANAAALNLPAADLEDVKFGETFHTILTKINFALSPKNSGFIRYSRFTNDQPNTGGGLSTVGRGTDFHDRMNGGAVQLATTIATALLNEFRFGINRRYELRSPVGEYNGTNPAVNISGVANFGVNPFAGSTAVENSSQFIDNLTWTRGRHTIKTGVDFQTTGYSLFASLNQQFAFQGLSAVSGVRPAVSAPDQYLRTVRGEIDPATNRAYTYSQLQQDFGKRDVDLRFNFINFFAQDEFRVNSRLSFNFGVRYEAVLFPELDPQAPFELSRKVSNDLGNVAPRIGLSWSPTGDGKTVIRAGYGIFYDTPSLALPVTAAQTNGRRVLNLTVVGTDARATRFPALLEDADATLAVPPNINAFSPDFQIMLANQASLQVSREITRDLALNVMYSYSGTRYGAYTRDLNLAPVIGRLADGRPVFAGANGRPDRRFRQINLIESGSNSNYHSFDLTLTKRFARGLSFSGNYSWSHALSDNEQEGGALSDPTDRARDYGTRNSDLRHSLVFQNLYTPRFSRSFKWVNGFEVSTMIFYNSGFPVTASAGTDLNGDLVNNDRPLFRGRNDVKGPDYFQMDFRLVRRFVLRDHYSFELIAEAENLTNRFNASCSIAGCSGAVVNVATAPDFGRITSVRGARVFQFGGRFTF